MIRIFFDTELQEDGQTIELISLGAVRSDSGATFYAESAEVDLSKSNPWVVENVHPFLTGLTEPLSSIAERFKQFCAGGKEWWADCPSYDWVKVSQLYGPMAALPAGWPYDAFNLRQLSAELGVPVASWPELAGDAHNALADALHHQDIHAFLESCR